MKIKAFFEKLSLFSEMLSPIGKDLPGFCQDARRYFTIVRRWADSEGTLTAVLRAKRVRHAALNWMLNQPNPCYSFLKTKDGFPKAALPLKKYLKDSEGRRLVLTVLDFYRDMTVASDPDFSSITDAGVPVTPLYDEIASTVRSIELSDSPEYHFTVKSGPNGPAIQSATKDATALQQDPELDSTVKDFLKIQNCDSISMDLMMTQMMVQNEGPVQHSKLSLKQEPGGKVRVFAICDYYSQVALRPLHKAVARILNGIRNDFTWNQDGIVNWLSEMRLKGIKSFHSIDLSSATDRFPAILQKKVVEKLVSVPFAELWYNLMTRRDFNFGKTKLRYSVGQPMGAYSSWPVFAFTHHCVVWYCAKTLGIRHPDYAIVGDDIVIADDRLAQKYREVLDQLGVPISQPKSLTGNCLEFCKRIWDATQEITPLPVKLLLKSKIDYRNLIQLNDWFHTRGVPEGIQNRLLISLLPSNERKRRLALIALTAPHYEARVDGLPIREDWKWPSLPCHIHKEVVRDANINRVSKVYEGMVSILDRWVYSVEQEKQIMGVPGLSAGGLDFLPTEKVIKTLHGLAERTHLSMNLFIDSEYADLGEVMPSVRVFDPQVLQPDRRKLKLKDMSFLSEVHSLCKKVTEDQVYNPVPLKLCDINAYAKGVHSASFKDDSLAREAWIRRTRAELAQSRSARSRRPSG